MLYSVEWGKAFSSRIFCSMWPSIGVQVVRLAASSNRPFVSRFFRKQLIAFCCLSKSKKGSDHYTYTKLDSIVRAPAKISYGFSLMDRLCTKGKSRWKRRKGMLLTNEIWSPVCCLGGPLCRGRIIGKISYGGLICKFHFDHLPSGVSMLQKIIEQQFDDSPQICSSLDEVLGNSLIRSAVLVFIKSGDVCTLHFQLLLRIMDNKAEMLFPPRAWTL
jgi:hypothetical protein